MAIQVIGAGLGRTGTLSLKRALEELGFAKCYHMVYEVNQGWGPLCAFLGVPVPEGEPFPHLNDMAEFRGRIERGARMLRRAIGVTAVVAVALVLIIIALVLIWRAP